MNMETARVSIALRLTEERSRVGFTQADFARKLDITKEGLRLYENGQRGVPAEFLSKAMALGIDVQYVLSGVRSKNLAEAEAASSPPVSVLAQSGTAIGSMHGGTVINTAKHVTRTIAKVTPGDEHITEKQASDLTALVDTVVETEQKLKKAPKTHRAVWAALNRHCEVTSYRLIPLGEFERARKYLHQWLGRLNAMPSAPVKNGDALRKRQYAYIKINSKDFPEAVDQYIRKNFKASSLTELSDEDLKRTYQYVAGRKKKG
jgi:DNA-binding XRE family transcriptional regulator